MCLCWKRPSVRETSKQLKSCWTTVSTVEIRIFFKSQIQIFNVYKSNIFVHFEYIGFCPLFYAKAWMWRPGLVLVGVYLCVLSTWQTMTWPNSYWRGEPVLTSAKVRFFGLLYLSLVGKLDTSKKMTQLLWPLTDLLPTAKKISLIRQHHHVAVFQIDMKQPYLILLKVPVALVPSYSPPWHLFPISSPATAKYWETNWASVPIRFIWYYLMLMTPKRKLCRNMPLIPWVVFILSTLHSHHKARKN